MINIINEICNSINNHFALDRTTGQLHGAESGEFTLSNGKIVINQKYVVGQYIAIQGAILNSGVFRVEDFTDGAINLQQTDADYPDWIRPTGVSTVYNTGDRVRHNNLRWVSLQNNNMQEPDKNGSAWRIVPGMEIQNPITDEEFTGTIYSLRVSFEFLMLVERIAEFARSSAGQASNVVATSFGIESRSYGTDNNGVRAGWQTVFRNELHKYRRHTPDIVI